MVETIRKELKRPVGRPPKEPRDDVNVENFLQPKTGTIKTYTVVADSVETKVTIVRDQTSFVPRYNLSLPKLEDATQAILQEVETQLLSTVSIKLEESLSQKSLAELKSKFSELSKKLLLQEIPNLTENELSMLTGFLLHDMLGLGNLEFLLNDDALEEVVINSAKSPVWVYHKEFGWLLTNITIGDEDQISNYASIIGRRVGRQLTILAPLMDAHLITGDRVNATLFPISSSGNTITIRKFRRKPWTICDLITNKTFSLESAALIWLAFQYEMSIIVSGGTGSGKTTFLNSMLPFIQPSHRILSIEDTRELSLPDFLHWVPMTTREPNPEGKGEITMLDLMVNSLRMRPDRIVVGEIRRQREAEVLFEAMLTGHSVYSTLHADTAVQTIRRMTTPPINIPESMLESLDLVVVMFRDRRHGIRRVFEIAEIVPPGESEKESHVRARILYRWRPKEDKIEPYEQSIILMDKLSTHTGLSPQDIQSDLEEKRNILSWMISNKMDSINDIGKIISKYYVDHDETVKAIRAGRAPATLL